MTQAEAITTARQINETGTIGFKITHVAMDCTGDWIGYGEKPIKTKYGWECQSGKIELIGDANDCWKTTLAEVAI